MRYTQIFIFLPFFIPFWCKACPLDRKHFLYSFSPFSESVPYLIMEAADGVQGGYRVDFSEIIYKI